MTASRASQLNRRNNQPHTTIDGMNVTSISATCRVVLIAVFAAAMPAGAQPSTAVRNVLQGTQGEYWVDPSTGLMWAAKDNGKDLNWRKATEYCHDLRLAGHSDWRLATIDELERIYDESANASGLAGKNGHGTSWHVKGNLFLTGSQWSSTQRLDDRGHPNGLVWYFDFGNKYRGSDDGSRFSGRFSDYDRRALCVRHSGE